MEPWVFWTAYSNSNVCPPVFYLTVFTSESGRIQIRIWKGLFHIMSWENKPKERWHLLLSKSPRFSSSCQVYNISSTRKGMWSSWPTEIQVASHSSFKTEKWKIAILKSIRSQTLPHWNIPKTWGAEFVCWLAAKIDFCSHRAYHSKTMKALFLS